MFAVAAVPLAVILTLFVAYAMQHSTEAWARPTVETSKLKRSVLAWVLLHTTPAVILRNTVGRVIDPAIRYIRGTLSRWTVAHLRAGVHWLTGLNGLAHYGFVQVEGLARDTAHALDRVHDVWIPRSLHRAEAFARHGIDALHHDIARQLARLRRYALGIDRLVRHTILPRVHRLTHTVEHAIPRELGRIRTRVGSLERHIPRGLTRRLSRLEKLTTAAALAAVFVKVLAKRFPWLFCRKVSALGRRLCGLDQSLIDGLLLDTLLIAGIVSVVEFTEGLQAIEGEALDLLAGFIDELPAP